MSRRTTKLLKAVLSTLHYSGADSMIAPFTRGLGAVLTLHHVTPEKPGAFEPSRDLKVTPNFLVQVIQQVRAAGFEIVSLDEAHFRLVEGEYRRPFVCLAFDDGYQDIFEHAYPILQRYDLPFAVYVPTDYPGGHGELWWTALERAIIKVGALDVKIDGAQRRLRCGSPAEKDWAFHTVYQWLRTIDEGDARAFVREMCTGVDIDLAAMPKWDDYTKAQHDLFRFTHTATSPWTAIRANDQRRARLEAMRTVLAAFDYPGKNNSVASTPDKKIVGSGPDFFYGD